MIPTVPVLKILPLDKLILHEDHDLQRTIPLISRLRSQGILRNPPIVMPLTDGSGRFMVLDGANRVTSLKEMEFPHIVAQVVESTYPHVNLQTWNHIVWGMKSDALMEAIENVNDVRLIKINTLRSLAAPKYKPLQIRLPDGGFFILEEAPSSLETHIDTLHQIVNAYKTQAALDRTSQTLIDSFKPIYPDLTALIIFPNFKIQTLLKLTAQHIVLPTGITRFTVSPRALHVNYPLHELSSGKPTSYKETYLKYWVEERIKKKGVRYYAEATFLFDE